MSALIRSLDVGYGFVKFTVDDKRSIQYRKFPSVACVPSGLDLSAGVLTRGDRLVVEADGYCFEVGYTADAVMGAHDTRVLSEDFVHTPQYLALARAALYYMNVDVIDRLVVGLPVRYLHRRSQELVARLRGPHRVVDRDIHVHAVQVLAQPVGGFIDYLTRNRELITQVRDYRTLIVDPGFYTLDYVVSHGMDLVPARSGHFEGGVSTVLKHIASQLGIDHKTDYTNLSAIDEGLRTGRFRIRGRDVSLRQYVAKARPVIEEAVGALYNTIGRESDIDNIVLVGGGARLYRPALEARFPHHPLHVVEDEIFANVRGFQICGETLLRQQLVA